MKNKSKKPWSAEDADYWKSMVDMIIGLLLVVLLVMSLMVLGLLDQKVGEGDYTSIEPSPSPTATPSPTPVPTPSPTPTPDPHDDWGGGGGGGDERHTPAPAPTPTPHLSDYDKSAVRVMVYDSESSQLLTEYTSSFNLYDAGRKLTLYVRYPETKGYSTFTTSDKGSFFLPEKMVPGDYMLKNLKPLEKYDLPDATEFTLEQGHDWDDPFIVTIEAVPCRNQIALTVVDAQTGDPVAGGSYRVIADREITAGDGSTRYEEGDTVETLFADRKGAALSQEIYLGDYRVEIGEPAFGYADEGQAVELVLERRRSADDTTPVEIKVDRTRFVITVRDGLNYNRLAGVRFLVSGTTGLTECVTDENGEITLVDLEKDREYSVTQAEDYLDYQHDDTPITFTVDEKGLIDGQAAVTVAVTENRTVCTFSVTGKILPISDSGSEMQLIDESGTVVKKWTSSGKAETINGVRPGRYTFASGDLRTSIVVENRSEEQVFTLRRWQILEYAALFAAAALVVGTAAWVILLRRRKRGKAQ